MVSPIVQFSATIEGMSAEDFAALEYRLLPMFSPALDALADWYKGVTAQSFDSEHGGLSGETATTVEMVPNVPNPAVITSRVRYGAHVGFVVDPIRAHIIEAHAGNALANPQVNQRPANVFSPFGPVRGPVSWYQGGSESFSPDTTWYTRWQPQLAVAGAIALERFGAVLQTMLAAQGAEMSYTVTGADVPGLIP